MKEELLRYYTDELRFMREMTGEFAKAYPRIASRLRLSKEAVEDPHVERLIQAFSLLNARVRLKLDDMFPELTDGLLSILHPQFLEPAPSSAIVACTPEAGMNAVQRASRGARILTEAVDGETCTYQTCYDVEVGPYRLASAAVFRRPLPAPSLRAVDAAQACLRLRLECLQEGATFTDLALDRVRFFISAEPRLSHVLYELIMNNTIGVVFADHQNDGAPVLAGPGALSPVGFGADEHLLPATSAGVHEYELFTEYFAFPEKFLFFEISGLSAKTLLDAGGALEIFLYFDQAPEQIERNVGAQNFRLFCTPITNAFRAAAEPVRIDGREVEHRIVPNARREQSLEVLRVESVRLARGAGDPEPVQPFFSIGRERRAKAGYWQAHRRASLGPGGGDDVFLSFVFDGSEIDLLDADATPLVASVDVLCTNRDLPNRLPFGGGQPALSLQQAAPGVAAVACLTAPTRTLRPKRGRDAYWRLLSQLSLNHLSLVDEELGADALKEMLSIHDHLSEGALSPVVEKIHAVASRPSTARAPGGGRLALCSGVDVDLHLDDERFSGSGGFLLMALLDRFLARYCVINSFSRLKVVLWKERRTLRRFPPRSGELTLV